MAEVTAIVVEVLKAGPLASVQDKGRTGYERWGVPLGGAMDRPALLQANALVGNTAGQPCIEIGPGGLHLRLSGRTMVAVTGAKASVWLNGQPMPLHRAYIVSEGGVLQIGHAPQGMWSYVAIAGEWQVPRWLGSASAVPTAVSAPGLPQPLKSGVIWEIQAAGIDQIGAAATPADWLPGGAVAMMKGPEWHWIPPVAQHHLLSEAFTISRQVSRMGYRLSDRLLAHDLPELISSPVVPGTVQLTRGGELIILMADAQTVGGYPRLGVLNEVQLARVAQMRPGEQLQFRLDEDLMPFS